MTTPEPSPPDRDRRNGRLNNPDAGEGREVMRLLQRVESGMDGPRSLLPEQPDEPVAYKLLDVAGDAIGKGEVRQGMAILRLVAKEYRHSQEAACARSVIDRLAEREPGRI